MDKLTIKIYKYISLVKYLMNARWGKALIIV